MSFEGFIKSRFATWILGIGLVFVMILAARVLVQKYRVDKEIAQLQSQVEKVKKDNEQLSNLIQYFNTPEYREKQAREKLNLKKDGEFVVGLPENSDQADSSQPKPESNFKKWLKYFFSNAS